MEILTQGYEALQRQVQAMETALAFQLPDGVQNGLLLQQNIDLVQENERLWQESVKAQLCFERMERHLDALERRLAAQELTLREERALRAGMRQRIDGQADVPRVEEVISSTSVPSTITVPWISSATVSAERAPRTRASITIPSGYTKTPIATCITSTSSQTTYC